MSLNPKASASRRRRQKVDIALYARALGGVEYVCPHCNRFQKVSRVNHRRPKHRCTNRLCNRQTEFGIHAYQGDGTHEDPPMNAIHLLTQGGPFARNILGRLPGSAIRAVGQIVGPIEWWCPMCKERNLGKATRGRCACTSCKLFWVFALILRDVVPGAHTHTPVDWIPPAPKS